MTADPGPEARRQARASAGGRRRSSLPPMTRAGFLVATVAVLLIAGFSFRSLQWRAEGARRVAHTLEVTQHLESLLSGLTSAESGQRGYLLTGAERYLEPYESAVPALQSELVLIQRLLADNPAQLERLDVAERLAHEKLAELKQTIDMRRAGRTEASQEQVRSERGRRAMDRLRGLIDEMKATEAGLLTERTHDWEAAAALSTTLTLGGAVVLLILIGIAGAMSSRDFRTQQREAWIQRGLGELGTIMQGEQSSEKFGDGVCSFLGRYVEAQMAVMYFADAGALRQVGGYALPAELDSSPDVRVPAGLTKQAFTDKTVVSVSDVPADYFAVSSALGRSPPRHLLIAPTSADGRANGVLELGLFAPPLPQDLDLLSRLAEPLGIALRTAKYRKDLEELLAETQRQAEALQTQQEELRVQNEELEQQGRVLQDSQSRLENQQAELEQINQQLGEQSTGLERQRDHLARAQGELQQANIYKSEFLANMSHELRTPLNSTLILAKLLADNRDGNLTEEQIKFARTIYSAGNDLLTLIGDILDLSKIEAGKLDVRPEELTLARLCDELRDSFGPVARDKGLELTVTIEPGSPATIFADPTRLQQILKNLLSNALKFTERGGVALQVRHQGEGQGQIAFAVKDTGIGIPPEQHDVIFEAFRQADGAVNRKYGGTGLGLSISRDLSRLLGGELFLQSAPGQGSTFTLRLPERYLAPEPASAPEAAAGPASTLRPAPVLRSLASAPALPRVARPGLALADPALADDREGLPDQAGPLGRVILIIEDDVRFAQIIQTLAQELDFKTLVATTGEHGLALAERHRPSAIVLDVGLPDRSGLSVLDALKHNPTTRHIPVHMMSVTDYAQTALQMGAAGYAIKPVPREQLIAALERLESKFTQKARRVLVVEDDEVARESTCRLLAADDVETVAVGTAAEALQALGSATFDCMVLDLSLPDRSGLDVLEEMSATDRAFPPVIVYTGRSLAVDEEQKLRRLSHSIIIKGARSPERLLDEVTLFLHQVESDLPPERQRMLRDARHREAVFEGRRVLVVEDDVRNIFALSSVLEPKGAKVEIARNGLEALAHLRNNPGVDLVLMDMMMPEMDGLQAMREIRRQPGWAALPIIALTAKAMADDREQCLAAGANDYIAKPLDVDKLLSLLRVWMPK